MIKGFNIKTIDDVNIHDKQVLLKVDFNVLNLKDGKSIGDDIRITESLPTIKYLLERKNRLIITTHISKTHGPDPKRSTKPIADYFTKFFPDYSIVFIEDIKAKDTFDRIKAQNENEIMFLENTRFYPEEKKKSVEFAKLLASFADIYVYEAFGVSHRVETTVVGVPLYMKTYVGLLMKKEVEKISAAIHDPEHPVVGIVGGAKITSKTNAIEKLINLCDDVLIGGIIGNSFLSSAGYSMGKSTVNDEEIERAREIYYQAGPLPVKITLPIDCVVGDPENEEVKPHTVALDEVPDNRYVLDIGPESQKLFSGIISEAKTIIWNGPMGMSESKVYAHGTKAVYDAITSNHHAYSVVGGGDTLNSIANHTNNNKISHISTGGGATITFIAKGTLPALEALKKSQSMHH